MDQQTGISVIAAQGSGSDAEVEARLIALVLDTVTSAHSRRAYRTGLERFFALVLGARPHFSKALIGEYRAHLLGDGLSSATVNLRLPPSGASPARWPTTACWPLRSPPSSAFPV